MCLQSVGVLAAQLGGQPADHFHQAIGLSKAHRLVALGTFDALKEHANRTNAHMQGAGLRHGRQEQLVFEADCSVAAER